MSVPRFTDFQAFPLKRVMLTRQPAFVFTPEDVEALVVETGLSKAQIQKWSRNFRERWGGKTVDETLDFLRGIEKVTSLLASLGFRFCSAQGNFFLKFLNFFKFSCSNVTVSKSGTEKVFGSQGFFLIFLDLYRRNA